MFKYLIKFKSLAVKITVETKDSILNSALQELRTLTDVPENVIIWAFDKEFDEYFILTDMGNAPDVGVLKIEEKKPEVQGLPHG